MKKNLGFTLTELLAVIVLLVLLVGISYPTVMEQFKQKENYISEKKLQLLYDAAFTYIQENTNEYPTSNGNTQCIFIKELLDENLITTDISEVESNKLIKIKMGNNNNFNYSLVDTCTNSDKYGSNTYSSLTCSLEKEINDIKVESEIKYYFVNSLLKLQDGDITLSYSDPDFRDNFTTMKKDYDDLYSRLYATEGIYPVYNNGTYKYEFSLSIDYQTYNQTVENNTYIGIYDSSTNLTTVKSNEITKSYTCE
ncbi:MAG: prepilin-type N-terminal cleavage/methylation domain-containing protein [Bacilli bacterium]